MDSENQGPEGQGCLFGWVHAPGKGKRGRPQHVRTPESANKIKLLLALGWSNERIAHAMGLSLPTLRKHYFAELKIRLIARDALEAKRAELLWAQCEKGNVGAMKAFHQLLLDNDRMRIADDLRRGATGETEEKSEPEAKPARMAPIGKKQGAVLAANDLISADPDLGVRRGMN